MTDQGLLAEFLHANEEFITLDDMDAYDGLNDPQRYRWDLVDGSGYSHTDYCNGDHSDVSGRCESDPVE